MSFCIDFANACTCPPDATAAWDCLDCLLHGPAADAECAAQAKAEIDAENAWLVAAEAPTADDLAFEQWEAARISPAEYDRVYGDAPYC